MAGALRLEGSTELGGHFADGGEVEMAIGGGWGSDTDEGDIRTVDRLDGIVGSGDASHSMLLSHESVHVFLNDGRTSLIDERNFFRMQVDADHAVTVTCEAADADATDIAESKDTNICHGGVRIWKVCCS